MSEADRSLPAREARVYASFDEAPTASAYGPGPAWVGGRMFWSDGSAWRDKEGAPVFGAIRISPHLVGYWPLSHQNFICARDVSGNRRHFVGVNGSMANLQANADGRLFPTGSMAGRLVNAPTDPRFNLTQPGVSFLISVVHRAAESTGALTVLGCGAVANGFHCGVIDNAGKTRFRTVTGGTGTQYSSDFTAPNGTDTHIAVLRDGTAGRLYVYLNGEQDSGYASGAGFAAYTPTAAQTAANLALCGYGNNVTGSDIGGSGASQHTLGHLQLYVFPAGYSVLPAVALIPKLAANPTTMLTRGELP